ncbi:hypothetical protein LXL04_012788 [Taraxacum kok-saghyz]
MFFSRYTSVVPSRFFPPPASPTLHPSFPAGSIDFSHLLHRPCIPKRPFPISPPNKCRFPISPPISASAREAASPTLQRFPFSPQTSPPASFNFNCYAVFSQQHFLAFPIFPTACFTHLASSIFRTRSCFTDRFLHRFLHRRPS